MEVLERPLCWCFCSLDFVFVFVRIPASLEISSIPQPQRTARAHAGVVTVRARVASCLARGPVVRGDSKLSFVNRAKHSWRLISHEWVVKV